MGYQTQHGTNLVKVLPAQAFEMGGVRHNHVHRPLGQEELVQAVVGDLGNGHSTAVEPKINGGVL